MTKINTIMKWLKSPIRIGIASLLIIVITYTLIAKQTGITGKTGSGGGCSCHGSGSSSTSLSVSGNLTVEPGSSNNYTVKVSNASQSKAGVNIAVKTDASAGNNAGTLSAGSGLQSVSGELTHTSPANLSGGEANFSFSWTAPSQAGEYYIRAAGNAVDGDGSSSGDQWNHMSAVKVTVKGVQLASPNGGETWCAGTSRNITWSDFGVTSVKIELSSDGGGSWPVTITSSATGNSYSWNIPSNQPAGNNYRIRVSDASNSNLSDASGASFSISGLPSINTNPEPKTACTGTSVSFSVGAEGSALNYQWRKNGSNISGANSPTYNIASVKLADAGNYDCVVSNSCGSPVTSSQAALTVDETPVITNQPKNVTVCKGSLATFSVTASGTDISYQWKKNNVNIDGATQSTYSIPSVGDADAGTYTVSVSGKCTPAAVSSNATLAIAKPASVTKQPADKEVCIDGSLFLSVEASGSGLTYQWRKNGQNIQGAKESTFLIQKVKESDSGRYDVVVAGQCGTPVTSTQATVKINIKPVITKNPGNLKVNENMQAKFTVESGNADSYQWRKNAQNIDGATGYELIIVQAGLGAAGTYDCVAKNTCGETISAGAVLEVVPAGSGPTLALSVMEYDFGKIEAGQAESSNIEGLIKNSGDKELIINSITLTGQNADEFTIENPPVNPIKLQPEETYNLELKFMPQTAGSKSASVEFTSNAEVNPSLSLMGMAYIIGISLNIESVDFGEIMGSESRTEELVMKNTGSEALTVKKVTLGGQNPEAFEIVSPTGEVNVQPDSSLTITIRYNSDGSGVKSAVVSIETDMKTFTDVVTLTGSGFPNSVAESSFIKDFRVIPNPVYESADIHINVAEPGDLKLEIYDLSGMLVKVFEITAGQQGNYVLNWDLFSLNGTKVSNGSYKAVLISKGSMSTADVIISK